MEPDSKLESMESIDVIDGQVIKFYKYHIVDTHYSGLFLNFNNSEALELYFLNCIYSLQYYD